MASSDSNQSAPRPGSPGQPPRRRRQRYSGTHPKQFEQRYKERDPQAYPQMQEHIRAQGRTPAGTHVPIMVTQVLEVLQPAPGEVVADCTIGYGGHAMAFLERIGPTGRLIGFDVDAANLERAAQRLAETGVPLSLHRSNFAGLGKVLGAEGLEGYDVVFADLGVSSMQVDEPARGFSYKHDGPLDMRMDDRLQRTAGDLLRTMPEEELSAGLLELADEPDHELIARAIVQQRCGEPLTRTGQLVDLIFHAKGLSRRDWREQPGQGKLHPAALTFQALRILVNDELASLRELLRVAPYCLRPGGRIGILSFHSGEDRLVKQAFRDGLAIGLYTEVCAEVVRPTAQEIRDNPRSSPAKLRWARR